MQLQDFKEKLTTIFLTDAMPPSRLLLLRRSANKKLLPNLYTGTGGKIENGEDQAAGAKRELLEETGSQLEIKEFGRMIINQTRVLCNFHGIYNSQELPKCTEGELEWFKIGTLPADTVPTAKFFLDEWQKRSWNVSKPFTIFLSRENIDDPYSATTSLKILEGLRFSATNN